jgi:two-component system CheB/CheR fusion protein
MFSVEVGRPQTDALAALPSPKFDPPITAHAAKILVVEDDPGVRALLQLLIEGEGHRLQSASDGVAALQLIERGLFKPDIVLTDYNLPNEMDGLQVARKLRELLGADLPVIVLTGDISKETMCDVCHHNCAQLNKPVKMAELVATINKLLPTKS